MTKEQKENIVTYLYAIDLATETIAGALQDIAIQRQNIFEELGYELTDDIFKLSDAREKMEELELNIVRGK